MTFVVLSVLVPLVPSMMMDDDDDASRKQNRLNGGCGHDPL
jgi:hypothetical protein